VGQVKKDELRCVTGFTFTGESGVKKRRDDNPGALTRSSTV
jgi:hypothetical protein